MATPEKEQIRVQWQGQFQKAQQSDSWGQVAEAADLYKIIAASMAAKQSLPFITSLEKDIMHRLVLCLSARAHVLEGLRIIEVSITSMDMKALDSIFEVLFTGKEPHTFPIEPFKFQSAKAVKPSTESEIVCDEEGEVIKEETDARDEDWQQAQEILKTVKGTIVCLRIEKIGLKDAQDYIDPMMTILVGNPAGEVLMTENIKATERRVTHVIFNQQVYLKYSLETMRKEAAALFFEFKHYKPKKKKVSTRCWCFMELNELKCDEEIVLEIYHKPTDLRKKKLKLHSEKPLYLHLFARFIHS